MTPYRFACEVDGNARWRTVAGGQLEVAVLREDGRLERHLVLDDGRTTLLETRRVPDRRAFWVLVCIVGMALFAATFVFLGVTHADENSDPAIPLLMALSGMALALLGRVRQLRVSDVDARLKATFGRNGGWHEPTNLAGWTPSTTAQLAAVERMANAHGGRVIVARDGSHACVTGPRRFDRYALDDSGSCELVEQVKGVSHARRRFNELNPHEWHQIVTELQEGD